MSSTAWQPWAAGAAAGSTMTLIGHPFDTLKTRMQTNNAYASTWACARQTVAAEGLLAVYKGLGPALATTCLTSGLRFGVQVREISARKILHFSKTTKRVSKFVQLHVLPNPHSF